jgi:hypothetical protein
MNRSTDQCTKYHMYFSTVFEEAGVRALGTVFHYRTASKTSNLKVYCKLGAKWRHIPRPAAYHWYARPWQGWPVVCPSSSLSPVTACGHSTTAPWRTCLRTHFVRSITCTDQESGKMSASEQESEKSANSTVNPGQLPHLLYFQLLTLGGNGALVCQII